MTEQIVLKSSGCFLFVKCLAGQNRHAIHQLMVPVHKHSVIQWSSVWLIRLILDSLFYTLACIIANCKIWTRTSKKLQCPCDIKIADFLISCFLGIILKYTTDSDPAQSLQLFISLSTISLPILTSIYHFPKISILRFPRGSWKRYI